MVHKHHIIPRHEWKIRFGNLKGFNAVDNLVNLTTEQHAQVHFHYFNEITHIEYDRIAGLGISGQIGEEKAQRAAASFSNKGKPRPWTDEWKRNISTSLKGRIISWTTKISAATRGIPKRKYLCSCGKIADMANLKRWHPNHKVMKNG